MNSADTKHLWKRLSLLQSQSFTRWCHKNSFVTLSNPQGLQLVTITLNWNLSLSYLIIIKIIIIDR